MSATNSTTHYELSQYVGTDKPTYLVDYNQDMSKIDAGIYGAKSEADTNASSIGTLSNLTTTVKTDLVSAVNEVNGETSTIGNVSNLTTTVKTDLVSAVNEVNGKTNTIGDLTNLTTTAKSNLVSAVNEVDGDIGDLTNLTTTAKSSVVASINEVDGDIGNLASLTTSAKTNVVSAINEIEDFVKYMTLTDFRDLSNPTVTQGGGSVLSNTMKIALNSSGTAGKIYGKLTVTGMNTYARVKFSNTGIMGVTSEININVAGLCSNGTGYPNQLTIVILPPTGTETSASIEVRYGTYQSGATDGYIYPCLYFFKDFGDSGDIS